ncbi:type-F conjugative transfer system pilin assembly protein TrbC [Escherichia coli]|nr:type-F conjugative transfer system pilin assembly protein TrbC [Escherichia coli]
MTPAGLLAPTYRNQLAFIDIFFRGMNNTNYNMAVCGTSGAGKTGLIQPLIRSVLDSGGFAVVFDMGDGYKSLCENMGGVYLDGETLRFNPFANITDIDQSAERVRDQLSVMASPNGNLDEVHEGLLLQAVRASWLNNDLKTTAEAVLSLVKDGATDGVQIDPTLFSQYGIRSVPALVVFCSQGYDIIRGNLRVGQALEKVAATGDCRQVAHDLLAGKGDSGK